MRRLLRPCSDQITKRHCRNLAGEQGLSRRIDFGPVGGAAGGVHVGFDQIREETDIDLRAPRMQVECALREFRQLADTACDGNPRHRVTGEVFEHATGKVTHVEQAFVRGVEQLAGSLLRVMRLPSR